MSSLTEYWNDRFCHTKMHYNRIHVQQGNTVPKRRKYAGAGDTQRAVARGEAAQVHQPRMRVFTFGSFSIERSILFQDQGRGLVYDAACDGAAEDTGLLREGAGEASAGEDLDFLMPTYSLWKWEQFDTPELYVSQLAHWLCIHNIAVKHPYDAVHENTQRQLDLSRMRLLK
jgi:hypothetical protein